MKTNHNPLTRSHFSPICTTGGLQPNRGLQGPWQNESIMDIETQFLDSPAFAPTGHCFFYVGEDDNPIALHGIFALHRLI